MSFRARALCATEGSGFPCGPSSALNGVSSFQIPIIASLPVPYLSSSCTTLVKGMKRSLFLPCKLLAMSQYQDTPNSDFTNNDNGSRRPPQLNPACMCQCKCVQGGGNRGDGGDGDGGNSDTFVLVRPLDAFNLESEEDVNGPEGVETQPSGETRAHVGIRPHDGFHPNYIQDQGYMDTDFSFDDAFGSPPGDSDSTAVEVSSHEHSSMSSMSSSGMLPLGQGDGQQSALLAFAGARFEHGSPPSAIDRNFPPAGNFRGVPLPLVDLGPREWQHGA
ncbi:hypothetical protein BDY21DRAFT_184495 [Lineolata rhizophorae]|uniref:Uncharacterized protein n=1 Tax=Lineolata rhizophorae TaxID=578093 RepID=A0A6A6P7W5_9PEZI|nr:hypothetical protein BDY21DRAFT_184495 [Lineolata rhizophorae]